MEPKKAGREPASLGDGLVGGRSAADFVDDEHDSILAERGEIRPELVLRDALGHGLALHDELEDDEASKEVDDGADDEAERGGAGNEQ